MLFVVTPGEEWPGDVDEAASCILFRLASAMGQIEARPYFDHAGGKWTAGQVGRAMLKCYRAY